MVGRNSSFDFSYGSPEPDGRLTAGWINSGNFTIKSRNTKICSIQRSPSDGLPALLEDELVQKPCKIFCTESNYTGSWNPRGMAGSGIYTLPHQARYEGGVHDGRFHGGGTLYYPMGQKVYGIWDKGDLISVFDFDFTDTLKYRPKHWPYCKMPDRRFFSSIQFGLNPVCTERRTNDSPPKEIPDGCYDTGDGFYNPITKCVFSSIDPERIIRIPTADEEKWILKNCRKSIDSNTGYRPDLYEKWTTGRRSEDGFEELLLSEEEEECTVKRVRIIDSISYKT